MINLKFKEKQTEVIITYLGSYTKDNVDYEIICEEKFIKGSMRWIKYCLLHFHKADLKKIVERNYYSTLKELTDRLELLKTNNNGQFTREDKEVEYKIISTETLISKTNI